MDRIASLRGRAALVTGAARRVGAAIVRRLAQRGCDVAIHYKTSKHDAENLAEECRAAGVRAVTLQADLADIQAAARLPAQVLTDLDRLDLLVNNASTFEKMSLAQFTLDKWEETLRVNLTAPMALVHAAADSLRATGGLVINMCDISSQRPWPDHLAYVISKGALDTLTKALARALAPQVRVVGIAPGVVAWPEDYDQATIERLTARIPLRRAGEPEDVASLVEYLMSEGQYLTGVIIPIDGGRSIA